MKSALLVFIIFVLMLCVGKNSVVRADEVFDGVTLESGLYWYGKGDLCRKYVNGEDNLYFDENKPTIIFFHGWQPSSTEELFMVNFNPMNNDSDLNIDDDLCDYWIDKGWNIGIFQWGQFSDESEVKDAESKIWSDDTSVSLRWRKVDGTYENYSGTESSVAEIFRNEYLSCMKNYKGNEVRFIGHSLGNQLETNSAKLIEDEISNGNASSNILPDRISLLDPFWSKWGKSYLDDEWTGSRCREYVNELKEKGVVFEYYKSSNINDLMIGDSNDQMKKMTVFVDLYPDCISFFNQETRHGFAKEWYIYSNAFESPIEYSNDSITSDIAPSAAMETEELRKLMDSGYYWTQKDGNNTVTPEDDTFNKVAW